MGSFLCSWHFVCQFSKISNKMELREELSNKKFHFYCSKKRQFLDAVYVHSFKYKGACPIKHFRFSNCLNSRNQNEQRRRNSQKKIKFLIANNFIKKFRLILIDFINRWRKSRLEIFCVVCMFLKTS